MSPFLINEEETKVLPCDVLAEAQVLGMILAENSNFLMVSHVLREDHFSLPGHRTVYGIIREVITNGGEANIMLLKDRFLAEQSVVAIGGANYIASLYAYGIAGGSVEPLAWKLVDLAKRRRIIELAESLKRGAGDYSVKTEEVESLLVKESSALVSDSPTRSFTDAYALSVKIAEAMDKPMDCDATGLAKLDETMLGGLHIGRAYCFSARMKKGKTLLAGTISHNLAERGVPHLFIAAEMGGIEVQQRTLARMMDLNPGVFFSVERQGLRKQIESVCRGYLRNIHFYDSPCVSLDDLKRAVHYGVHKLKIRGFILDYWQLVSGKQKGQLEEQHLQEVAQWAAAVCKKQNIWCVMTAQVNKEGNLLYGEGVKRAFDQVYELHTDDKESAWMEMYCSRYTPLLKVGSSMWPAFINVQGSYFKGN